VFTKQDRAIFPNLHCFVGTTKHHHLAAGHCPAHNHLLDSDWVFADAHPQQVSKTLGSTNVYSLTLHTKKYKKALP